jgi:hypothetical protein
MRDTDAMLPAPGPGFNAQESGEVNQGNCAEKTTDFRD